MTKAAGLRKTVHPTGAADVYPSIGCGFFVEFIFLYDFLQNVTELYLGKFGLFKELATSMLVKHTPGVEITLLRNILIRRSVVLLVPASLG